MPHCFFQWEADCHSSKNKWLIAIADSKNGKTGWLLWFVWLLWFIWFLWSIRLVWFNQIDETNQTNQTNQSNQSNQRTAIPLRSDSDEVDVPSFDVRAHEFHSHTVSHVEATRARHHFPFDRRLKEPDPRASV